MADGDIEDAVGVGGEGDHEAADESAPIPVPVDEETTAKAVKGVHFPADPPPLTARDRRITTPSGIPALLAESMTTVPETEPAGP